VFKGTRNVFDALGRKVTPYDPGKELVPGITSVATNRHTPGHNSHIVSSGGKSVYVQADVTNHPALFVRNPGWHAFFDQDAAMAEATRHKV
jgi:glyoxylase-like metal-dependent hydrolase (beta-lactamase superfamily II)